MGHDWIVFELESIKKLHNNNNIVNPTTKTLTVLMFIQYERCFYTVDTKDERGLKRNSSLQPHKYDDEYDKGRSDGSLCVWPL